MPGNPRGRGSAEIPANPRGRGRGRGGQSAARGQLGGGGLLAGGGGPPVVPQNRRTTRSTATSFQSPVGNGNSSQCGTCNTILGDDAIGCDLCTGWYHPSPQCTGLNMTSISAIQNEGGDGILYKCSKCRCLPQRSGSTPAVDPSAIPQLFEMVRSLATTVADLTGQVRLMCSQNVARPSSGNDFSSSSPVIRSRAELFSELREFDEQKKRRCSLIVKGIQATTDDQFVPVFQNVSQVLTGTAVTPDEVYCINRENKIYRVKVLDFAARKALVEKSKELKNDQNFSDVYINRDLTFTQRQELRGRRQRQGHASDSGTSRAHADTVPVVPSSSSADVAVSQAGSSVDVGSDDSPQQGF